MSWVKLDDKLWSHPKIAALEARALKLWLFGLCWCNQQETDGVIPRAMLAQLGGTPKLAGELVKVGLWHATPTGWEVHDYLVYQPSKARLEAERGRIKERVARHRQGPTSAACNGVTATVTNADVTGAVSDLKRRPRPDPIPIRSDHPDPPIQDLTGHAPAAPSERSVDEVQSTCPADLQLTDAQVATLAMGLGAPADRLRALAAGLVARWCVDDSRRMPRVRWQQRLASAVSSDWNRERSGKSPAAAPGRPADELSDAELAKRQEAFRRAKAADEERGLAEMATLRAKLPPARTTGGVGTAAEAAAGLLADLEAARAKRAGASS